jgi:hypothetical protein
LLKRALGVSYWESVEAMGAFTGGDPTNFITSSATRSF